MESDPLDEGNDINILLEYSNFEAAFERIDQRYPWHLLYITELHDDFTGILLKRLAEKLNREKLSPREYDFRSHFFFEIKSHDLVYRSDAHNNYAWQVEEVNQPHSEY